MMILIGQYDSSYTRRVAIALRLYGIPFEHRPWSVGADQDRIRPFNPLTRVPTLILEGGETLLDSSSIIDFIDSLVEPERRLYPVSQPARRRAMRVAALASGMADKAVALFYELHMHAVSAPDWVKRCRGQILGALAVLESERAATRSPWWFGADFGHADIAVACHVRHAFEAHPDMAEFARYPALQAHCEAMESMDAFRQLSQPLVSPV
jgi:glutathione S-transferase